MRLLGLSLGLLSITLLLFVLADCGGASTSSHGVPPPPPPTVVSAPITCPTSSLSPPNTACYSLAVTCENTATYSVYLKSMPPSGTPVGAASLIEGGTSIDLYEQFAYGSTTVQNLLDAGFLVVEISFGHPFTDSEGGWQANAAGLGVRAASCRYANVTAWIKTNLAASIPLCATGSSAGSAQIAEGLAHYGLGNQLAFAELTSGPPFTRTDEACIPSLAGNTTQYCAGNPAGESVGLKDAEDYIDPAYPGPWCSESIQTGDKSHQSTFLNDSITSPDGVLNYPSTPVWFLYGGLDTSPAINQGELYRQAITSSTNRGCVADAPHNVPDSLDGAQQIAADIILNCKAPGAAHSRR